MKRNRFLGTLAAVAGLPFLGAARINHFFKRATKPFKIGVGEGRKHGHLKLRGVNVNIIDVKISGSDTDGDLAMFEQTSMSPGRGTPLHVHLAQDEIFYVLEGSYKFKVGDQLFDLAAGESIFLPRQVPHAWTQVATKGRMMVILQPAGKLEDFFVSVAGLDHEPQPEEMKQFFSANEMEVVGPPLNIE